VSGFVADSGGIERVAFTTRHPGTAYLHPGPRLSYSADCCVLTTFCVTGWPVALLVRVLLIGTCFVRVLGYYVLNHVRKPRVSWTPENKVGLLLGHSPAPAIFSVRVVPDGRPSRGTDMSVDMRLVAGPEVLEGSKVSEPLAECLGAPTGYRGLSSPPTTAAPSGKSLPGSGMQGAAASPEVFGADSP
jgi:hypothetical protein